MLQIDFARVLLQYLIFLALEELDLTPWKPLGQKLCRCVFFSLFQLHLSLRLEFGDLGSGGTAKTSN